MLLAPDSIKTAIEVKQACRYSTVLERADVGMAWKGYSRKK